MSAFYSASTSYIDESKMPDSNSIGHGLAERDLLNFLSNNEVKHMKQLESRPRKTKDFNESFYI